MMSNNWSIGLLVLGWSWGVIPIAQAQVTAASDGLNTTVTTQNLGGSQQYDITAGTQAGTNVFHSFQQFRLNSGDVANFVTTPAITNVLGRVVGGQASIIDGTLRVTGSNANLYLMNPAGIVFGTNATLDLPASFLATTAAGIGFAGGEFNQRSGGVAGDPQRFNFNLSHLAPVVNGGFLEVEAGRDLVLVGGNGVNTGLLWGGNVGLAAVRPGQVVTLRSPDHLLSLDITSPPSPTLTPWTVASLPSLLTGTGVTISPASSAIQPGDLILRGTIDTSQFGTDNADGVVLRAAGDLEATESEIRAIAHDTGLGGKVFLSAGGKLTSGTIYANSNGNDGGSIVLNSGGDLMATDTILADGQTRGGAIHLVSGGKIDTTSAYLSAWGYAGDGGTVQLLGQDQIAVGNIDSYSLSLGQGGNLTIRGVGDITLTGSLDSKGSTKGGQIAIISSNGAILGENLGGISSLAEDGQGGNLTLQARGDIVLGGSLDSKGSTDGGQIAIISSDGAILGENLGGISSLAEDGQGGNLTLQARGDIVVGGYLNSYGTTGGGQVHLTSTAGSIDTSQGWEIGSFTDEGHGGDVTLTALGDIKTTFIRTFSRSSDPGDHSGNITLTSRAGEVNTTFNLDDEAIISPNADITSPAIANTFLTDYANLDAYAPDAMGGKITINAAKGITTGHLSSFGKSNSGAVTLISDRGTITTGVIFSVTNHGNSGAVNIVNQLGGLDLLHIATYANQGSGGTIHLTANGSIRVHDIASYGDRQSGNLAITLLNGNLIADNVQTIARNGTSGNIFINNVATQGNLYTANILSQGGITSGNITLQAPGGEIRTGNIASLAGSGIAGNLSVTALQNITTGNLTALGGGGKGDVTVISDRGTVATGTITGDQIRVWDVNTDALISNGFRSQNGAEIAANLTEVENRFQTQFDQYFGTNLPSNPVNPQAIQNTLQTIEKATGDRSAQIYIQRDTQNPNNLQLLVFSPEGQPISLQVPAVSPETLAGVVKSFRNTLVLSARRQDRSYLADAEQLYNWLIRPLDPYLAEHKIQTLLFSLDSGLRSVPLAALYDGRQFLIEKYGVGMVPSFGLMQSGYASLAQAQVLAMGATQFTDLAPLPAVSTEVNAITQLWKGERLLNRDFTKANLIAQQQQQPRAIIHLATHADFAPGDPNASYIHLWNDKLSLKEIGTLDLKNTRVELLVLSACKTAVGNPEAELGFAGLAVASGAKTALASLWSVSDEGTLALMTEFYNQLRSAKVKSEALRQAQLAMLYGKIQVEDGQVRGTGGGTLLPLPPELAQITNRDLSNPYYWSGFTMVGSPW